MTIDHSVTNTEQLEQQNPAIKTKLKLKKLKDQVSPLPLEAPVMTIT